MLQTLSTICLSGCAQVRSMRNPQGDVSEAGPSLAVQASTGERNLLLKWRLACATPLARGSQ